MTVCMADEVLDDVGVTVLMTLDDVLDDVG